MTEGIVAFAFVFSFAAIYVWSNHDKYADRRVLKGVLRGIFSVGVAVVVVVGLAMISGCAGTWNNGGTMFVGLERTKHLSPQCEDVGPDNRTTSNLGFRWLAYQHEDFSANAKYTHHSCAFSPDDKSYDALGFELEYRLW